MSSETQEKVIEDEYARANSLRSKLQEEWSITVGVVD